MNERTVVLDCRWLRWSGTGRVLEYLLRSFVADPPPHRWVLWGGPEVERYAWPGAEVARSEGRPNAWRGQRDWFRIPQGDLVVFSQQQRPLRRVPAMTWILDTIPLTAASNSLDRWARTQFLRVAAARSREILTISEFSRRSIETLGVDPSKISVLNLPIDDTFARRGLERRARTPTQQVALYVGLFSPHKNLKRLLEAFSTSDFRQHGGRLVLVGGKDAAAELSGSLSAAQHASVDVVPLCTQDELEQLFASSLFLVQPSLLEGFGLSVWEALSIGLPVCVSDGGALPEVTRGTVQHFAAASTVAMRRAIDDTAAAATAMTPKEQQEQGQAFAAAGPTLQQFGQQFLRAVERNLHGSDS